MAATSSHVPIEQLKPQTTHIETPTSAKGIEGTPNYFVNLTPETTTTHPEDHMIDWFLALVAVGKTLLINLRATIKRLIGALMNDTAQTKPTELQKRLDAIDKLEGEILRKGAALVPKGAAITTGHFYAMGIIKRTITQASGFRQLIEAKNFQCAAAILRLQIDSAMRMNAVALVADREEFFHEWLSGTRMDRLTAEDGERMRDVYLRKKLAEKHPWIEEIYSRTSDFIHFSARHFFTSIVSADDESQIVRFAITAEDPPRPESDYFEIADAFFNATRLVGTLTLAYLLFLSGTVTSPAAPSSKNEE